MDMIRLEHVSKTFTSKHGSVEALKDVSLTIEKEMSFEVKTRCPLTLITSSPTRSSDAAACGLRSA